MSNGRQDYLLLNARAGWRASFTDPKLRFGDDGSLRLRPQPGSVRPLVDEAGSFGGLTLPTGLALDAQGGIYILETATHLVKQYDPCCETFRPLSCVGGIGSAPRRLRSPRGLAISGRHDLYIADTGNRRIQIFALKGLPLREIWGPFKVSGSSPDYAIEPTAAEQPAPGATFDETTEPVFPARTWQPYDIALAGDNRAYVSDYANGLIHVFNQWGKWETAYDGAGEDAPALEKPTHLAVDQYCRLYVLQEGKDYVTVLGEEGQYVGQVKSPEEVKGKFCPVAIAVDEEGNLCISERIARRVYSYCLTGDGCQESVGEWRAFEGVASGLAFDKGGHLLVSDAGEHRVCRLAEVAYELEGRFISEPLDSRIYHCQWHRIVVRAAVAQGTQLRIDTFCAESPKSAAEIQSLPERRWATGQIHARVGEGEWDCLVLSQPGRFLWLRLTLTGEGTTTPEVQEVQVYYPRSSSLQYLPAVYSEDAVSRDFMDRFLSIFDTIWGGISGKLTNIASYFDPAATPADTGGAGESDFLAWLASWLDLTLERHWPEEKRRRLLQQAHLLYRLRGTPEGLRLHVALYTDTEPRILEHFKLRRWAFLNHVRLGDQTSLWGKEVVKRLQLDEYSRIGEFQLIDSGDPLHDAFHHSAHQFTLFVPLRADEGDTGRQTIERIVEMAKPAHTLGQIQLVRPRLRIGIQSFVGVDTVIGRYPDKVVEGESRLGVDSMLGASADEAKPPTMRVGVRTRIGSSTFID